MQDAADERSDHRHDDSPPHAHPELLGHGPQRVAQPQEEPAESGTDLLTVALLVFFVSLIVIVAALLAWPVIF